MDRKSLSAGILFIIAGALILADNLDLIRIDWEDFIGELANLWPLILIVIGAGFWLRWMQDRSQVGSLLPGSILITYGILFLYLSLSNDWWQMGDYNLWAFFIIGPGLGFLAMYLLGKRERGVLVTSLILLGIGVLFLSGADNFRLLWPLILIIIGLRLLLRNRKDSYSEISTGDE